MTKGGTLLWMGPYGSVVLSFSMREKSGSVMSVLMVTSPEYQGLLVSCHLAIWPLTQLVQELSLKG